MKKDLGQVFTPKNIVEKMISLITVTNPKILEPSSGNGAFYNSLILKYPSKNITAIEIDSTVAHENAKIADFFDIDGKYDLIIGNPPYVDFKNISKKTLQKISETKLIHKPNLYMFFLEKSLKMLKKDGEIIFIIPTEWMLAASFSELVTIIDRDFSIQYFEIIPENIWDNASVTTAIVKIKKGSHHKKINYYISSNNKLIMGKRPKLIFSGKAVIKVGAASGNNNKFLNTKKGQYFIVSSTERTGKKVKMNYLDVKDEWIRKIPTPPKFKFQIFVNSKTRKENPFYILEQREGVQHYYDASVLCIYCDAEYENVVDLKNKLNKLNWDEMGIKRNGRYHFTQSILEGVING